MTQELLRRLTRSGTIYLIPAEIHSKSIIRFTVTSQFTTAEDIQRDWGIISKTASTLLAERQVLKNQPRPAEDGPKAAGDEDPQSEDVVAQLEKTHLDLWIDKTWDRPRRPMRSLSCSSEPLRHAYIGSLVGQDLRPGLREASGGPPSTPEPGLRETIPEMPSNLPGQPVLKKLTKFHSVPSFCNQWVQCGRYQLCCPLRVSQGGQKHNCRRRNCPSSTANNTAASTVSLEAAAAAELLEEH